MADVSVILGGDNPAMDTAVRELMLLFAEWLDADQHILVSPMGDMRSHTCLVTEFFAARNQVAVKEAFINAAYAQVYGGSKSSSNLAVDLRRVLRDYTLTKNT